MDRFAQILYDFGKEMGLDLYPDTNRICEINCNDQIHVQLIYEEAKEEVLIATFICEVPPGKYREKLLKTALMANNEVSRVGTFSFSEKNNQLTLFTYLPAPELTGEILNKTFSTLVDTALQWKDAVENGKPLPITGKPPSEDGMFGLKS